MREIPLVSVAHPGLFTLVDDHNFEWLNQYRWNVKADVRTTGVLFYARMSAHRSGVLMHRLILNAPEGVKVDHIDHDGLHNWEDNIRLATCSQNMANMIPRGGSSIYKGVSFHKRIGKWQAQASLNGRKVCLGYYETAIEAAIVYNGFALKHHGEFACLNQIPN